jgi:hypothetical protein
MKWWRESPLEGYQQDRLTAILDHMVYELWWHPELREKFGVSSRTIRRWVDGGSASRRELDVTQHVVRQGPIVFLQMYHAVPLHYSPDPRSPLVHDKVQNHWRSIWWVCVLRSGDFVYPEQVSTELIDRSRYRFAENILPVSFNRIRGPWWPIVLKLMKQFESETKPLERERLANEQRNYLERAAKAHADALAEKRRNQQILSDAEATVLEWNSGHSAGMKRSGCGVAATVIFLCILIVPCVL